MMNRTALLVALLASAAPAYATELNPDVGMDDPTSYMAGTGITVTGSKAVFTNVTAEKMLMQMNVKVLGGHRYLIDGDVTGYGGIGSLRPMVGVTMPTAPAGRNITAASEPELADTFDATLGLDTGYTPKNILSPGDSAEVGGAIRFNCGTIIIGRVDPLVYRGRKGPHLHENAGPRIGINWEAADFRTPKGGSSCANQFDPNNTVNGSSYLWPLLEDGLGNAIKTEQSTIYYKGVSDPSVILSGTVTGSATTGTMTITAASSPILAKALRLSGTGITVGTNVTAQLSGTAGGVGTYTISPSQSFASTTITVQSPYTDGPLSDITNACANGTPAPHTCIFEPPPNIRFTAGYRASDGMCGPTDTANMGDATTEGCSIREHTAFDCWGGPNNEGGVKGSPYTATYRDLASIMAAHVCATGSYLHWGADFPFCWDNIYVETADRRSNVTWGDNASKCLAAHRVRFPTISVQNFSRIDAAFQAGLWGFASDDMATSCAGGPVTRGCTFHIDYWEAWSAFVRHKWANCIRWHLTCSTEISDGHGLKGGALNFDNSLIAQVGGATGRPDNKVPLTDFGECPDVKANGHFSCEVTADTDGVWSIAGLGGVSAQVDNVHLSEQPLPVAKGPVTPHN